MAVNRATTEHLFEVINSREDVLRRLIRRCAYLKYVEARLGDRTLYADEILKDGFFLNMIDTSLYPLKVVTNMQEAVWDADIVVNGLPSTETREIFEEISKYWKERISTPVIISLSKGIEASLDPVAALYGLSFGGLRFKGLAKEAGVEEVLQNVEERGIERAKAKARRILAFMRVRYEEEEETVNWEALLNSEDASRTQL